MIDKRGILLILYIKDSLKGVLQPVKTVGGALLSLIKRPCDDVLVMSPGCYRFGLETSNLQEKALTQTGSFEIERLGRSPGREH